MSEHDEIAILIHSASGDMTRRARKLEISSDRYHARGQDGHAALLAESARLWRRAAAEVRAAAERYKAEHAEPAVDLDGVASS